MFSQKRKMSMSLSNGVSRSLLWLYAGHLLQVLRQEFGSAEHQKKLNWAQEMAMSWQIAKRKRVERTLKTNRPQSSFPPPLGKIWSEKDQTKKNIGDKTPRKILPVLAMKGADMKMVNKRVRGWTSNPYFVELASQGEERHSFKSSNWSIVKECGSCIL